MNKFKFQFSYYDVAVYVQKESSQCPEYAEWIDADWHNA